MAILAFQKPDKVLMLEADNSFGKFEFRPLEPGYGVTIGNALRRILLSGLEGFAICSIRIDGVQHEFATIPGVKEDVTNIILNLKKVRLKRIVEDTDTEKAVVKVSGQSVFKAGDIGKVLSAFEVLNPELEICHIDPASGFQIELSINKGRGYLPAEENRNANDPIDLIAIDSIYTPILNVKTAVENFRVEQKTDYEKLVIEITTDGSIHPKDALKGAAEILIQHFQLFTDREIVLDNTENNANEEFDEEVLNPELEICHIDPSCGFQIELSINKGRGYRHSEENKNANDPIDVIAIDSIYTPILNVKTTVENFRVEQKTDYEKLILEITTDGSIHPKEALKGAAEILIQHFQLFTDREIVLDNTENNANEEFDEEVLKMRQLLKTKLVDMDLSVRALNCLKSAEVETLGELVVFNKTDLLKFRNFGKKSLSELEELLATRNLHFGMDITKYKLEKE